MAKMASLLRFEGSICGGARISDPRIDTGFAQQGPRPHKLSSIARGRECTNERGRLQHNPEQNQEEPCPQNPKRLRSPKLQMRTRPGGNTSWRNANMNRRKDYPKLYRAGQQSYNNTCKQHRRCGAQCAVAPGPKSGQGLLHRGAHLTYLGASDVSCCCPNGSVHRLALHLLHCCLRGFLPRVVVVDEDLLHQGCPLLVDLLPGKALT